MSNEIELFIDEEYKNIYISLNVDWLKGFKSKTEKISYKGLANSGVEQSILTNYAIELLNNVNEKIKNLLEGSQEKFNFIMKNKKLEDYINKSIKNNNNYLEKMEKDLICYFNTKKNPLVESCKIQLRNAKFNNKISLEKIKKELILINKSKNKKSKWLSMKKIIVGILVPIIIFILGLLLT